MTYTFGRISVDGSARTIAVAREPAHLTRKAFDLLLLLLEHRGSAVSKDSIYARLWPETFVAESSLQTLVHEIRQAIDTARRAHPGSARFTASATASRETCTPIRWHPHRLAPSGPPHGCFEHRCACPSMWEKTSLVVEWRT